MVVLAVVMVDLFLVLLFLLLWLFVFWLFVFGGVSGNWVLTSCQSCRTTSEEGSVHNSQRG